MNTSAVTRRQAGIAAIVLCAGGSISSGAVFAAPGTTPYATSAALQAETTARIAADAAEANARQAADTAEAQSRQATDVALQGQIDTLHDAVGGTTFYVIGDTGPAGGKVFYVAPGGLHGFEAALADQSPNVAWGCSGTDLPGAYGTAVGTGAQNTIDIVANCSEAGTAARIAANYSLNGYDDWFLPSRAELLLLYQQQTVVGGFNTGDFYLSSTEFDYISVWSVYFISGITPKVGKDKQFSMRAIRAF